MMTVSETLASDLKIKRVRIVNRETVRIKCYFALMLADAFALTAAFLGANLLYLGNIQVNHGVVILTVILPVYIMIASFNSSYGGDVLDSAYISIKRTTQSFLLSSAFIMLIAYFLKASADFSRAVFGIGVALSLILLTSFRFALREPILRLLGGTPYSTVVIRDDAHYDASPFDIVLDARELRFDPANIDPFSYHALAQSVANADRVIISCPQERYQLWSSVLKGMAIDGEILTDESDHLGIIGLASHGARRTLVVSTGPLNVRERILKRAFDLAVATAALIVVSPILLATAIAIRIESKGPIIFVQNRIGRDNKIFRIYKFRSMYAEACDPDASRLTSRNDGRVTAVGDFIRRTSIDELPQLFNVLKGDMSIVGPRPHAISAKAADQLYWDVDPRYRHRHSMKPGLTGLAQVRGFRGATDRKEDLTNRLIADLEYMNNWSIWKDMWIVVQTLLVFRHNNAF